MNNSGTHSDKCDKEMILKNAKTLKNNNSFSKVYISPDLPVLTRKENSRLYQAFKAAKSDDTSNQISLRNGQLTINGAIEDRFNIGNQLFRD